MVIWVSSTGQAGARHSSLDTQKARFDQYCRRLNFLPAASLVDIVSGKRDDRKEYLRMVDYVMRGGADVIVVQFLDRFGRNPREILQRYWQLQDFKVSVVDTDEDIQEELILLIKAGIAGPESRRTSERVRSNMGRAVEKGVQACRPPCGLSPIREIKGSRVVTSWQLDPIEAPIVREMFRLAVEENLGYKAIADRLPAPTYVGREGRPFAAHTIDRELNNEALMGDLVYGKRPKQGNPQQELVRVCRWSTTLSAANRSGKMSNQPGAAVEYQTTSSAAGQHQRRQRSRGFQRTNYRWQPSVVDARSKCIQHKGPGGSSLTVVATSL